MFNGRLSSLDLLFSAGWNPCNFEVLDYLAQIQVQQSVCPPTIAYL